MRTILLSLSILAFGFITRGQETSTTSLLKNDANWTVEHFPLPTGFAQEMTISGTEEAFFPPGWSNVDSPELWSYVFVWAIESSSLLSEIDIEDNLEIYFDGLMGIPKDTIIAPKLPTTAVVVPLEANDKNHTYVGKVRTFDRFRSQQMMTLNIELLQKQCALSEKTYIVIRFSPQTYVHPVWKDLRKLTLQTDVCSTE